MKPILFNTEMVRAILDDRKTVTRRVVKDPYYVDEDLVCRVSGYAMHKGTSLTHGMPYPDAPYCVGDILYVRETWQYGGPLDGNDQVIEPCQYYYAADGDPFDRWLNDDGSYHDGMKWRPSIHMPKEAARIFLRVTDVRVERLKEITHAEIKAEGTDGMFGATLGAFSRLWNSTVKPADSDRYGWNTNPWVWVITFERCEKPKETDPSLRSG